MADNKQLEQMKQKYASVLTTIEQQQVRLIHVHIQDNKLFIQSSGSSLASLAARLSTIAAKDFSGHYSRHRGRGGWRMSMLREQRQGVA
jgi:hypothetical protein